MASKVLNNPNNSLFAHKVPLLILYLLSLVIYIINVAFIYSLARITNVIDLNSKIIIVF